MTIDVAKTTVVDLARAYRDGSTTPLEVTEAYLERIRTFDEALNAFATVMADAALAAAARASDEIAGGLDRGPLHGVPFAVKDLIAVQGVPTEFGSRVGRVPWEPADAEIVRRLREGGAVLLGKTNLLEYAYGVVHPDVGPTVNPWDRSRTAGGSSGGSAAAVAAGLVAFALGTDTGGSIRIPASYCGIAGLKPTWGRLPLDGVFPLAWSLDAIGPMARTARDASAVFAALAGTAEPEDRRSGLRRVVLGVPNTYIAATEMEPGVASAFARAIEALREAGARVIDVDFGPFAGANEILLDLLFPEASVIHEQYIATQADGYAPETRTQIEHGRTIPATRYVKAQRAQATLKDRFPAWMEGMDAVLMPSVPFVAPAEDPSVEGQEGAAEMHFSGPFNLLGVPAITVPGGSSDGLPVGLQLAGRAGADGALLALATALEQILPQPGTPPVP